MLASLAVDQAHPLTGPERAPVDTGPGLLRDVVEGRALEGLVDRGLGLRLDGLGHARTLDRGRAAQRVPGGSAAEES